MRRGVGARLVARGGGRGRRRERAHRRQVGATVSPRGTCLGFSIAPQRHGGARRAPRPRASTRSARCVCCGSPQRRSRVALDGALDGLTLAQADRSRQAFPTLATRAAPATSALGPAISHLDIKKLGRFQRAQARAPPATTPARHPDHRRRARPRPRWLGLPARLRRRRHPARYVDLFVGAARARRSAGACLFSKGSNQGSTRPCCRLCHVAVTRFRATVLLWGLLDPVAARCQGAGDSPARRLVLQRRHRRQLRQPPGCCS